MSRAAVCLPVAVWCVELIGCQTMKAICHHSVGVEVVVCLSAAPPVESLLNSQVHRVPATRQSQRRRLLRRSEGQRHDAPPSTLPGIPRDHPTLVWQKLPPSLCDAYRTTLSVSWCRGGCMSYQMPTKRCAALDSTIYLGITNYTVFHKKDPFCFSPYSLK